MDIRMTTAIMGTKAVMRRTGIYRTVTGMCETPTPADAVALETQRHREVMLHFQR